MGTASLVYHMGPSKKLTTQETGGYILLNADSCPIAEILRKTVLFPAKFHRYRTIGC